MAKTTIDADNHNTGTPPISDPWQPISPRYATALRLYIVAYAFVLAALLQGGWFLSSAPPLAWFSGSVVVIALFLVSVWVPRRVRYTRYQLRELDIHMQTGYWWRTTTSVATNRVQHLEITQGPVERLLGIAKLVLYTAGGQRSDLKLPGLEASVAEYLKQQLLKQIVDEDSQEEAADDASA